MLVDSRRVTKEQIRWQLEAGYNSALQQQQENVQRLLKTVYAYDIKTAPKELQKQVSDNVARIKAHCLAYREELRAYKNEKSSIGKTWKAYERAMCAGREFCKFTCPHLTIVYDMKFELACR